jgi:hypothetical protein
MPQKMMIRIRKAVVVLACLVSAGIYIYLGRLLYERLVRHVPDTALFFSALHSDWAVLFMAALASTVVGPAVLTVVCAYAWVDAHRRSMWVGFAVIILAGLFVAYAPSSLWHRLTPA